MTTLEKCENFEKYEEWLNEEVGYGNKVFLEIYTVD